MVALGIAAHAAVPYLPMIGPPALRVQVIKSPATGVVKYEGTKANSILATNLAAAGSKEAPAAGNDSTNLAAGGRAPGSGSAEDGDRPLSDTFSSTIFALPTPDLLGINPQMLAAYLLPVQYGTNTARPEGMLPLSFIPPLPPDKSSRAEYNVK